MSPVLAAFWLQAMPDTQTLAWWLPSGETAKAVAWWVAFTLNLAVLLFILYKLLFAGKKWSIPQALRGRGAEIQQQLRAADTAQQEAQARLAEVERRIARLPEELAGLKAEAEAEAEREYQRLVEASRREADHLIETARRETSAAAKLAQQELKGLAAALAVDLASQRLRERLTPELDQVVVQQALEDLQHQTGLSSLGEQPATRPN